MNNALNYEIRTATEYYAIQMFQLHDLKELLPQRWFTIHWNSAMLSMTRLGDFKTLFLINLRKIRQEVSKDKLNLHNALNNP